MPRSLVAIMTPHFLLALLLASFLTPSYALIFRPNNYFSNNMVLQRAPQQAVMWGYGEPGSTVTVTLDSNNVASGTVADVGTWSVRLPATEKSLNHSITVSDGTTSRTMTNVAFGDVFLCSGQSNMQVTLNYSFGAAEALAAAPRYPNIRLFNVPAQQSNFTYDEANLVWLPDSWVLPANNTLQNPNNVWDRSSYFSATCYWTAMHLYDSLNGTVPLGLVQASVGGTQVASWTSNDTNLVCGPLVTPFGSDNAPRNWPSVEYNAMIHPLLPMRFTAVLWYQGETDWWDADRYACSFPNMIQDWRTKFKYGPALGFYFVLIHPYSGANPVSRESQKQALLLPNVGVANAIDLGDRYGIAGDIHPRNKSYVGERLARLLRRDLYQQSVEVEGPTINSVDVDTVNSIFTVTLHYTFDERSTGLFALPTPDCSTNATDARRCCSEQPQGTFNNLITYSWSSGGSVVMGSSPATIDVAARTITIADKSANVPAPGSWVVLSYAYVDFPGCALYNEHRLPALPFRMNVTVDAGGPPAVLRLNNFFSNNMVLQRAPQQAVMWGYGEPGSTVTVKLNLENVASGTVTAAGTWSVQLPATDTSLFNTIGVSDGTTSIELQDVAFGDVYLCSGQSNMQISLNYSFGGAEAIAAASQYHDIRLFSYYSSYNDTPMDEQTAVAYSPDTWVLPRKDTLQPFWDPMNPWAYFSATCYWTGKYIYDSLNGTIPIGLVQSSFGGTPVMAWTSNDTNTKCGPYWGEEMPEAGPWEPSNEYNAMIHPLLPARFAGVLWYQGESDGYNIERYKCSFPNMIQDWRTKFQTPDLPFYFVLLSPYYGASPWLRDAQLSALASPNVGVASAIDLGDKYGSTGDIHPRNKSYVGERLARWVRRDIYKQQVEVEGPHLLSVNARIANSTFIITLRFSDDSRSAGLFALPTPDCNTTTTDATRCCDTQTSNSVTNLITYSWDSGNGITSRSSAGAIDQTARTITLVDASADLPPTGSHVLVSYAWADWPGCALYNEHRLPALPFIRNVTVGQSSASLMLHNLFGSDMVLQRAPHRALIWGYGEPGSTVTVMLDNNNVASGMVSDAGTWKVELPATEASMGRTITVSDGTSSVLLSNVAFGDVYLCSGQSNMQVTLNYSFGGADAIAAAASRYPNLRLFNIPGTYSNSTLDLPLISYAGGWVHANVSSLQFSSDPTNTWVYFSATCFWAGTNIYDSLKGAVPIGLVQASYGGSAVHAWTSPDTNTRCGPLVTPSGGDNTPYNRPSVLYNAMIHPLLPLRLRAVLWYQGETDWWDADRYACSFPNMIQDWRMKFNQSSLPFYFVELAPYMGAPVAVRESQKQALLLPMTGVANAIDLGDRTAPAGDVHPRNKSYVGERLARLVRSKIYGENGVESEGPQLVSATASLTATTFQLTLQFVDDSRANGMFALATPGCSNSSGDARGCCMQTGPSEYSNLIWYQYAVGAQMYMVNATVRIDTAAHTMTTTQQPAVMPLAGQPLFVLYAYVDWPGCALYNGARLPALPFRMNVTVTGGSAPTPLRLNNLFSNNMVLQRAPHQAVVWGYGEPGRTVNVRLDNQSAIPATVSNVGAWSVQLPATEASMGRTITVSDGTTTVSMTNVAFGDVYLCSGQSNMQVTLNYSFGGAEAIAVASRYPNLRLFNKPPQNNTVEQIETYVSYSPDTWVLPAASTLNDPYDPLDAWMYFSATCYWAGMHIYDSLNGSVPIGLVQSSFGGTVAAAWTSTDANTDTKCGPIVPLPAGRYEDQPFNYPSVLYNAMIHPLLPMRFTAVLWYQGESDFYDIDRYRCSFPAMIADWRDKFQMPDLPFYFVLLSPYTGYDTELPMQRLAQLAALSGSHMGVASAIDLGDRGGAAGDIHPRNKSYVGERLARWVRRDIYRQDVQPLGPEPLNDANGISVTADGTSVTVVLTYPINDANSGLYMLPAPGCTSCCHSGSGVLIVTVNDTSSGNSNGSLPAVTQYRPPVTINQQAYTVTATMNLSNPLSSSASVLVGMLSEAWPECVLYNRHNLPALPFLTAVPTNAATTPDDDATSTWYYAAAAAAILLAVGVVIWLVVHYGRKRRAAAEAEAGGYREVDERRTNLLGDDDSTSSS